MAHHYPSALASAFVGRPIIDLVSIEAGHFIKLVFEGDLEAALECPLASVEEMDKLGEELLTAGSVAAYKAGRRACLAAKREAEALALAESRERAEFFADWNMYQDPMAELRPEYIERAISKGWLIVTG